MIEEEYILKPVGVLHTPFNSRQDMPIQGRLFPETRGEAEINPKYAKALDDLEGFSHIILLYWFHKSGGYRLKVKPFLDDVERGLFSTRAPARPNQIGFCAVKLLGREDNILKISGVDMLDGTPLLDVKPYVSKIDSIENAKDGWMRGMMEGRRVSDSRFK